MQERQVRMEHFPMHGKDHGEETFQFEAWAAEVSEEISPRAEVSETH